MFLLAHVYSILAFAELLTLFASVIGILVFAVRLAVRAIDNLLDAAISSSAREAERRAMGPGRLKLATEGRSHKIRGGHNEHF